MKPYGSLDITPHLCYTSACQISPDELEKMGYKRFDYTSVFNGAVCHEYLWCLDEEKFLEVLKVFGLKFPEDGPYKPLTESK